MHRAHRRASGLSTMVLVALAVSACVPATDNDTWAASHDPGKGNPWYFQVENQGEKSLIVWVRPVATTTDLGDFRDGPVTKVTVKPGRKDIAAKTDASTYDESVGYIVTPRLTARGYILVIEGLPGGPLIALGHPAPPGALVLADRLYYREYHPETDMLSFKKSALLPEGKVFESPLTKSPVVLITIDAQGSVTFSLTPETMERLVDAPAASP